MGCCSFIAATVFLLSTPVWLCPPTLLASQADSKVFLPGPQHCTFYRVPWPRSPFLKDYPISSHPRWLLWLQLEFLTHPSLCRFAAYHLQHSSIPPRGSSCHQILIWPPWWGPIPCPQALQMVPTAHESPWCSLGPREGASLQMTRHWRGLEDLK